MKKDGSTIAPLSQDVLTGEVLVPYDRLSHELFDSETKAKFDPDKRSLVF